jgi:hypothetical protein
MRISPELQRNVWLEMSPTRLLVTPAVLLAILFLLYLAFEEDFYGAARNVAVWGFILVTYFWGARQAAESVTEEISDRTWDMQRMSSISSWELTTGKLFGSTVFAWYTGIYFLGIFIFTSLVILPQELPGHLLLLVLVALLAHGLSLLSSLHMIQKTRKPSRSHSALMFFLVVAFGIAVFNIYDDEGVQLTWYGNDYDTLWFLNLSGIVWLAWTLLGLNQYIRRELQLRNGPWLFAVFILFAMAFFAGFLEDTREDLLITNVRLFSSWSGLLIFIYVLLLTDRKDPILLRRALYHFRKGNIRRCSEELPAWFTATVVLLLVMLAAMLFNFELFQFIDFRVGLNGYMLSLFVFLLRDIGLILYLNLLADRRRADGAALVYLAVLYFLIPMILALLHLEELSALFIWQGEQHVVLSIVSGTIQAVIMVVLVSQRWRRFFAG